MAAPRLNSFPCQAQANQLQVPVVRPKILETTGLGAAFPRAGNRRVVVPGGTRPNLAGGRAVHARGPGRQGHRRWRTAVERSEGLGTTD